MITAVAVFNIIDLEIWSFSFHQDKERMAYELKWFLMKKPTFSRAFLPLWQLKVLTWKKKKSHFQCFVKEAKTHNHPLRIYGKINRTSVIFYLEKNTWKRTQHSKHIRNLKMQSLCILGLLFRLGRWRRKRTVNYHEYLLLKTLFFSKNFYIRGA